ncbi:MAG: phosphatase [Acidobacteria bacterium]|nr:MAG: phosphatase [Acidobacteriota bacterium]
MKQQPKQPTAFLFLDFDGTISKRDVTDAILEQYADKDWLVSETEWRAGRIGSRACLSEQMALVRATRKQIDALVDSIEVDEGFNELLEICAARNVQTHIVSDGFDCFIDRILERAVNGNRSLVNSISASHLKLDARPWRTEFPFFEQSCGHGCATCKPAVMRLVNPANAPAIFVGDGLSDRYAVERADLVFAKSELADYCRVNSIAHTEFERLTEVATDLDRWPGSRAFLTNKEERRVIA